MTGDSSGSADGDSAADTRGVGDSEVDSPDSMTLAPPVPAPLRNTGSAIPYSVGAGSSLPGVVVPPADYTEAGVPSLDFVRDKIEGRYARSLGSTELAQETTEARTFAEQAAEREAAAKEKLDAIRRSLRGDAQS